MLLRAASKMTLPDFKTCMLHPAGMGCSAGMIAIGLAERLLKQEPGKYALVLSTENISLSWHASPPSLLRVDASMSLLRVGSCICADWQGRASLAHVLMPFWISGLHPSLDLLADHCSQPADEAITQRML